MDIAISMLDARPEPVQAGDEALLAAARRGEPAALDSLYRRHARQAFSLALRITGQHDQAEDAVQDAFLKAFERLDGFRGDAPFRAWLKRLVVNAAIDRLRLQRRLQLDATEVDSLAGSCTSPERGMDALGLLARLSPAARSVVVLHDLEGYSHAEIAASFSMTESWSKTLLSRARMRLKQWLNEETSA